MIVEGVARVIAAGGVVAVPTDTVLGLACDPTDPVAVQRIYAIKGRPEGLELPLLAADPEDLEGLVALPPVAEELARRFWPGALTLVVPLAKPGGAVALRAAGRDPGRPDSAGETSAEGGLARVGGGQEPGRPLAIPRRGSTLAVRVPDHSGLRQLLLLTGPLAVTSANRHGESPATTVEEVHERLGSGIDAVLDGAPGRGSASTIIDCATAPPRILRAGPISHAELSPYLGGSGPSQQ